MEGTLSTPLDPGRRAELIRIWTAWLRLNLLDDVWVEEIEVLRDTPDDQRLGRLAYVLRDMERLLGNIPRQGQRIIRVLRDDDGIFLNTAVNALSEMEEGPDEVRAFANEVQRRRGGQAALRNAATLLVERSGPVSLEFQEKRFSIEDGELPPSDLPHDVKCALVLALTLLGLFVGIPWYSALVPGAVALIQMGCIDML